MVAGVREKRNAKERRDMREMACVRVAVQPACTNTGNHREARQCVNPERQ